MLNANILNRPNLVLLEKENHKFSLYPCTKEEAQDLEAILTGNPVDINDYNKHLLHLKDNDALQVDMVGCVDDVRPNHVHNLIARTKLHKIRRVDHEHRAEEIHEYPCYQSHKNPNPFNNIIVHEEKVSSFKCGCELLQSKYFVVLKINKKVDDGDTNRDTSTHTESPSIGE